MMAFVTTMEGRRRAIWMRIFGSERLPVKSARPRLQGVGRHGEMMRLAYDLDAGRLHWMAATRFADYLSARYGYPVTVGQVDGFPIRAAGCVVVENEESRETAVSAKLEKRPFPFVGVAYA